VAVGVDEAGAAEDEAAVADGEVAA